MERNLDNSYQNILTRSCLMIRIILGSTIKFSRC